MLERVRRDMQYYLNAHQNKNNRVLHYFAFLAAFLAWICLLIDWRGTVLLAFLHYLLSWIGHFCFERNKPASFRYPHIGFYIGFAWFFIRTWEGITGQEVLKRWMEELLESTSNQKGPLG